MGGLRARALEGDKARAELASVRTQLELTREQHRIREEDMQSQLAQLAAALQAHMDVEVQLRAQVSMLQQDGALLEQQAAQHRSAAEQQAAAARSERAAGEAQVRELQGAVDTLQKRLEQSQQTVSDGETARRVAQEAVRGSEGRMEGGRGSQHAYSGCCSLDWTLALSPCLSLCALAPLHPRSSSRARSDCDRTSRRFLRTWSVFARTTTRCSTTVQRYVHRRSGCLRPVPSLSSRPTALDVSSPCPLSLLPVMPASLPITFIRPCRPPALPRRRSVSWPCARRSCDE